MLRKLQTTKPTRVGSWVTSSSSLKLGWHSVYRDPPPLLRLGHYYHKRIIYHEMTSPLPPP